MFGRKKNNTEHVVKAIREGGKSAEKAVEHLYEAYRNNFVRFVQSHNGDQEEALDVFQDAIIAVINNIERGVFKGESNIKTYLFSIGRRKWYKRFNKKMREVELNQQLRTIPAVTTEDPWIATIGDERVAIVRKLMNQLKEKNRRILLLWMEGYNMTDIASLMGLKNAQVARNYKSRAMKELTTLLDNNTSLKSYLYL